MNNRNMMFLNRRMYGSNFMNRGRRRNDFPIPYPSRPIYERGMHDGLMYNQPMTYPPNRYSDSENERYNYERSEDYARGNRRDGHSEEYYQPVEFMGKFNGYYGVGNEYDYARGRHDYGCGDYHHEAKGRANGAYLLSDEELRKISEDLLRKIDEKDRQFLTKEHIRRKVDEIGIKFERFTFEELYMTMLMLFKDYNKILGTANIDIYPKLARAFLEDDDAAVRYGEKLALYYDYIVMGEGM